MLSLSIVIPVLNEADGIEQQLHLLRDTVGEQVEIIVVDGGSTDNTVHIAKIYADKVLASPKGRAVQMNTGARQSKSDYLLFLHSDTVFPQLLPSLTRAQLFPFLYDQPPNIDRSQVLWGFYPVILSSKQWPFRIIECLMNFRSQFTRVATGDQCLFVQRQLFIEMEGFANIPLMEDVEMSKRLRRQAPPLIPPYKVTTSSRRWEQHGVVKTVLLMWYLRALYFLGVTPDYIVKKYY